MFKDYRLTVVRVVVLTGALLFIGPLAVRSQMSKVVDGPVRQPVTFHEELLVPAGLSNGLSSGFPVPTGKRFVIEFVAGDIALPSGQRAIAQVFTRAPAGSFIQVLSSTPAGTFPEFSRPDIFTITQQSRMYSDGDPFNPVKIGLIRNNTTGDALLQLTFSGFFENIPGHTLR
jgi:hypothetical protein